jgi:hypothetical protein
MKVLNLLLSKSTFDLVNINLNTTLNGNKCIKLLSIKKRKHDFNDSKLHNLKSISIKSNKIINKFKKKPLNRQSKSLKKLLLKVNIQLTRILF